MPPIIVSDATDAWLGRSKWTFDYLKATYGGDVVCPQFGLYGGVGLVTKLAAYLDSLDAPGSVPAGFWVDINTNVPLNGPPRAVSPPLYLVGWRAFQKHPELLEQLQPTPYFMEDWTRGLGPFVREYLERSFERVYLDLLIGPAGSLSALHRDFGHTHACLSQIQGRKLAILFSPEDSAFLYGGRVDPEHPDLDRFPSFVRATAYEAVLEPGDMLVVPPDWWHYVRGLEKSITLSYNFFNRRNVLQHMVQLFEKRARL